MGYGGINILPLNNNTFITGRLPTGVVSQIIGRDIGYRVSIDPDGLYGSVFGGDVTMGPSKTLWMGGLGPAYGIRDNAGTLEFKNSGGGAWTPFAASAASAGGWTKTGAVVALTTGTDAVVAGAITVTSIDASVMSLRSALYTEINAGAGSAIYMNGDSLDVDVAMRSDTNPNHFISDAGAFAGVGAISVGTPWGTVEYFSVSHPALTSTPGNGYFMTMRVQSAGPVTLSTPTSIVASLYVNLPNINANGQSLAEAYTVFIGGAPTQGTNNGALWISSGQVRFSGMPTSAAGLPSGTLWSNSGVVNVAP